MDRWQRAHEVVAGVSVKREAPAPHGVIVMSRLKVIEQTSRPQARVAVSFNVELGSLVGRHLRTDVIADLRDNEVQQDA